MASGRRNFDIGMRPIAYHCLRRLIDMDGGRPWVSLCAYQPVPRLTFAKRGGRNDGNDLSLDTMDKRLLDDIIGRIFRPLGQRSTRATRSWSERFVRSASRATFLTSIGRVNALRKSRPHPASGA